MSYIKTTDFAIKDSLLSGNPAKLIRGTDIDVEFTALQTEDALNVKLSTAQTLTNKTIALGSNTISGTTAQFNTALTDGEFATAAGSLTGLTKATGGTVLTAAVAGTDYVSPATQQTQNAVAFTTAGTAPNFTLTPTPLIGTYTANQRFRVNFNAAGTTGSNTLDVSGLGAKNLKQYDSTGAKVSGVVTSSMLADVEYDGTDMVILNPLPTASTSTQIQPISASVGSGALTISASALSLQFRSTTLGSGTVTTVSGTPANLVISSGSTLGTVNGVASRIAVIAMNNAGTIELAAVNVSSGNPLDETNLISTTAEGGAGAADSANVIYSTTARSSLAYRVIGFIDSTQATAGTWATAPSTIQGAGGFVRPTSLVSSGSSVATTSGTAVDFTGIPSWVKRITLMLNGISTSGTSLPILQIGAGSIDATGYLSYIGFAATSPTSFSATTGFAVGGGNAANLFYGQVVLTTFGSNIWVCGVAMGLNAGGTVFGASGGGNKTLSGTLDRIRLTTVGGTDTFDAGSVNILYE